MKGLGVPPAARARTLFRRLCRLHPAFVFSIIRDDGVAAGNYGSPSIFTGGQEKEDHMQMMNPAGCVRKHRLMSTLEP